MIITLIAEDARLTCLQCAGKITMPAAADQQHFEELLGPDGFRKKVLLNLVRAEYIDSSGVSWLIQNHRRFKDAGGRLVVHDIPPLVNQVLQLLKIQRVLDLASDEPSARALALQQGQVKSPSP